jgi:hypothetical protein
MERPFSGKPDMAARHRERQILTHSCRSNLRLISRRTIAKADIGRDTIRTGRLQHCGKAS